MEAELSPMWNGVHWHERAKRAEAAVDRVRALHAPVQQHPNSDYRYCAGCDFDGMEAEQPEWPCRTIAALDSSGTVEDAPTLLAVSRDQQRHPRDGRYVAQLPEERSDEEPKRPAARLIIDRYFSKCSACNGNADPSEAQHIHGGPGSGYRKGSGLSDTNGCGATFVERYYVADCRTEPIDAPVSGLPVDGETTNG